jgi:hypothetical protein
MKYGMLILLVFIVSSRASLNANCLYKGPGESNPDSNKTVIVGETDKLDKTIRFNFHGKRLESNPDSLESIDVGDFYNIEIDSINLNLYKIIIGTSDSSTLKPIDFPSFEVFKTAQLSSYLSNLIPTALQKGVTTLSSSQAKDVKDLSNNLTLMGMNWRAKFDSVTQLQTRRKEEPLNDTVSLLILMNESQTNLKMKQMEFNSLVARIQNVIFEHNKLFVVSELEFLPPTMGKKDTIDVSQLSLKVLYDSIGIIKEDVQKLDSAIQQLSQNYDNEIKYDSWRIRNLPYLKTVDSTLRIAFYKFDSTLVGMHDSLTGNKMVKYIRSLANIMNTSWTYKSLPKQRMKDQTFVDITILPRDSARLESYTTHFAFPLKEKEFWGVSSGFYYGRMNNQSFSVKTVIDASKKDTSYSLADESPVPYEFGMDAIFHYGRQLILHDFFAQIAIGPAVTFGDKIRPRLMVGAGIAFGDKNILLLDIGTVFGYTDRLSNSITQLQGFRTLPTDYMVSTLDHGLYLSVSYLFYNN